jgi:hypothetical protein
LLLYDSYAISFGDRKGSPEIPIRSGIMSTVEEILAEARKLPPEEQRQLASALLTEAGHRDEKEAGIHAALAIVEETTGTIKGLDRETLITLAEDEEFSGY